LLWSTGNNFFCSCERVFNPALAGKPVVVLSNNDGCIISRSDEAKALDIPMGAPLHEQQAGDQEARGPSLQFQLHPDTAI